MHTLQYVFGDRITSSGLSSPHSLDLNLCNFLLVSHSKGFKGKAGPVHNMKTYRRVQVQPHTFLTSAIGGSQWFTSRPGHFTPGEKPRYQQKWRLGGPQM